ncbi:hypothetical protein CU633_21785 [Bacillus sp. V3-13]|uniref:hypothetical protein n=1 Tax=Bacillus sp. V3-13 TaxID=2053728 RepID=UPI000C784DDE|nr:hypothetical protein [Bacillus sp. V3-13]PLR75317.1 hypothetical protein CU633_21785 [Bacillus sp. V3-13]
MNYQSPVVELNQREKVTGDEYWWVGLVLLFVVWAYSQYAMQKAVSSCSKSGGLAKVDSYFWGTTYKVSCYDK